MEYIVKLHRSYAADKPDESKSLPQILITTLATRIKEDSEDVAKGIATYLATRIINKHPCRELATEMEIYDWQEDGVRTQSPYCLIKCFSHKSSCNDVYFLLDLIEANKLDKVKNKANHKVPLRYQATLYYSTPFYPNVAHKTFTYHSQSFEEAQYQAIGLSEHHINSINHFTGTEKEFKDSYPIRNLKWEEEWTEDRKFTTGGIPIHDYILIGEMPWNANELIVSKFRLELKCVEKQTQLSAQALEDSIPDERT